MMIFNIWNIGQHCPWLLPTQRMIYLSHCDPAALTSKAAEVRDVHGKSDTSTAHVMRQ